MAHKTDVDKLLDSVKEFALTVGEDCPEGHRREPSSGRCLPMGPTDHTAFTRSLNDDQGPLWRGEKDKNAPTFDDDKVADRASQDKEVALMDAFDMDEPVSCSEGTTFSFVQRKCVTPEEAALEDAGEYVSEADHSDIIALDPEGRRDTVNFECPPDQMFDHKLRQCIPLNKDTVMAFLTEHASRYDLTFGLPAKQMFPLDTAENAERSIRAFAEAKWSLRPAEQTELLHNLTAAAAKYNLGDAYASLPTVTATIDWINAVSKGQLEAISREFAAELKTKTRNALPDSSFGVPSKRKFPLHDCNHVRNAMSRFNQAKGLSPDEKATLRRKIVSKAKTCGIEIKSFAAATTTEEFNHVVQEMLMTEDRVRQTYSAEDEKKPAKGPCPPFMTWDPKAKKCLRAKGYLENILKGNHSDIIALDPEGRKDTVNFECPPNQMFDHKLRQCIPLNKDTVMGSDEEAKHNNELAPSPKGRPARLPSDCPAGTLWDADLEDCKPLDSRKKTKSDEDEAKAPSGPGKTKCGPDEIFLPFMQKCMPKFKKKAAEEQAGREGLTTEVPGKVKLPQDCPPNTIWDGTRRTCTPLDPAKKNRPSGGPGPMNPKDVASMSTAQLIKVLDEIIKANPTGKDVAKVAAKDLPNEAFPPSLVRASQRSLLHHNPDVTDPYDNASVNVARLRNALARVDGLKEFSEHALAEAKSHLLYHAREVVKVYLGKN